MYAIYALKGNYEFQHNIIETVLPVFYCGGGTKRIIENDITCPKLFYNSGFNNGRITGNIINGNISIPGTDTIIDSNRITGTIETTPPYEYVKVKKIADKNPKENNWYEFVDNEYVLTDDTESTEGKIYYKLTTHSDARSRITNNVILDPTEGGTLFEAIDEVYFSNNRIRNIRFKMVEDGVFTNNEIAFNANFVNDGGIIINVPYSTFSNNTINYAGSDLEDKGVYLIRAKTISNNIIRSSQKIRYVFYTRTGGSAYIEGNIL